MTTMVRLILPLALAGGLAACAGDDSAKAPETIGTVLPAAPATTLPGVTADAWPQALAQAYTALAEGAPDSHAGVLKAKADAAGAGTTPDPEPATSPALLRSEAALRLALANNAGTILPREAATAQAAYDCLALTERTGAATTASHDCRAVFDLSLRELWARG